MLTTVNLAHKRPLAIYFTDYKPFKSSLLISFSNEIFQKDIMNLFIGH